MKYFVLVLEVLSLLKHVRQPTVQCSRPVNEQQHDHTTVDFVAENRVPPVTQVIDMLKEMKVKTVTTKSQEQVDNPLALLTQEGLQKQMAFASKSQLYKDTTEMKARDVEEAQMQILAPSTKIEQAKTEQGDLTARVLELEVNPRERIHGREYSYAPFGKANSTNVRSAERDDYENAVAAIRDALTVLKQVKPKTAPSQDRDLNTELRGEGEEPGVIDLPDRQADSARLGWKGEGTEDER